MLTCPHCSMRVIPKSDGVCPSCGQDTSAEPEAVPESLPAWETFQQSVQAVSPFDDEWCEAEREFALLRSQLVSDLGAGESVHTADVARIESELLPKLAALREQAEPTVADSLETREQSWRALVDAARREDSSRLLEHMELWSQSQTVGGESKSRRTVNRQLEEFRAALVSFTPRTWVVAAIVVVNVIAFIAMSLKLNNFWMPTPEEMLALGGNFAPRTMNGEWWRLLTCMFLHYGLIHLALNMVVLWQLGNLMERLVGNFGFLVLYVFSGLMGSILSLVWNVNVVSAGASGAVFGVCGGLLGFLVFRHNAIPKEVINSHRNSLLAFLGISVFYGVTTPGIDVAAHAGGALAGFVAGMLLSQDLSLGETPSRRRGKNLLLFGVAIATVPAVVLMLPEAPVDVRAVFDAIGIEEEQIVAKYVEAREDYDRRAIDDFALADRMDDLLRQWRSLQARIEEFRGRPIANQSFVERYLEYFQARETSWKTLIAGLRQQDEELFRLHLRQEQKVADLLNKIAQEHGVPLQ